MARRLRFRSAPLLAAVGSATIALCGCGLSPEINPSFSLAAADARTYLKDQKDRPFALSRPLLILAGWQDPGFGARGIERRLRRLVVNPHRVVMIHFFTEQTFDGCRRKVLDRVESQFPSGDKEKTREVDVIGISMGGLVARHASRILDDGRKRLRIRRLFSIGTPHTGATLAGFPTWDQRQVDMRDDSDFLRELNADPLSLDFQIVPYARLGDEIVGIEHTAPPGRFPWWVPNLPFQSPHLTSASDPRILADIVSRLREEEPFAKGEPLPPPPSD